MDFTFSTESSDPATVVEIQQGLTIDDGTTLDSTDVAVRFLAFPINPQDLMAIAGKYPVKPVYKHPDGASIAGNDGLAQVERTGSDVTDLQAGDYVLPKRHGLGTWRQYAILPASSLIKLHPKVDPISASLLKMGFLPAYFLIEDMRSLKPGDWIVINAARGVIPQMVVQFARLRGCKTVAVVREHESSSTDADMTVTEEALQKSGSEADSALAQLVQSQRIVLALDAVFGSSAELLASLLAPGATFVNYGSLGGADKAVQLTQQLLFWKQITFRNFRLSQQLAARSDSQQEQLLSWCASLLEQDVLKAPHVEVLELSTKDELHVASEKVRHALKRASEKTRGTSKQVVVLR